MTMRMMLFHLSLLTAFGAGGLDAKATKIQMEERSVVVRKGDVYDGVRYPPGSQAIFYGDSKSVGSVILSQDFKMNGRVVLKGSRLELSGGKLTSYSSVEGQKIGDFTLHDWDLVSFGEDGALKMIGLHQMNQMQGFAFAEHSWVELHPSGKVAHGTLAEAVVFRGLHLRAGSEIKFYPSGEVRCVFPDGTSQFGEYRLAPDYLGSECGVEFWPNGKLKSGVLAETARINGVTCGPGRIYFLESGPLNVCQTVERAK